MRVNVTFLSLSAAVGLAALFVATLSSARAQTAAGLGIRTGQARQQETGFGNASPTRSATRAEIAWVAGGEFRDTVLKTGPGEDSPSSKIRRSADRRPPHRPDNPRGVASACSSIRSLGRPSCTSPVCASPLRRSNRPPPPAHGHRPGRALAADWTYRVAMTRTLAIGSFGFFRLWPNGRAQAAEPITVGEAFRRLGRRLPVRETVAWRSVRRNDNPALPVRRAKRRSHSSRSVGSGVPLRLADDRRRDHCAVFGALLASGWRFGAGHCVRGKSPGRAARPRTPPSTASALELPQAAGRLRPAPGRPATRPAATSCSRPQGIRRTSPHRRSPITWALAASAW